MALSFCLLTQPRSGSQFLFSLVKAAVGADAVRPTSGLTPGRREKADQHPEGGYQRYASEGRPLDYFSDNGFASLKIEYPANDRLAFLIADHFPKCCFLSSYRPFAKIARSHARLSWGLEPLRLLENYRLHVEFLKKFRNARPIFFVDIENASRLRIEALMDFLGKSGRVPDNPLFFKRWLPVNDLNYRRKRDGEADNAVETDVLLLNDVWAEAAKLDAIISSWVNSCNVLE